MNNISYNITKSNFANANITSCIDIVLHNAIAGCYFHTLKYIIHNHLITSNERNRYTYILLNCAVMIGRDELLHLLLLQNDVQVNAQDDRVRTPLHLLLLNGEAESI